MKNITLAFVIMFGFCATEAAVRRSTFQDRLREQQTLREQREQVAEFDALMMGGKLNELEEEFVKSQLALERLSALEGKSKTLSAGALAIYNKRLKEVKHEYETCSNRLAHARAMLTPEKVAEFEKTRKILAEIERAEEEKKSQEQRNEAEYWNFAAAADNKIAEKENEINVNKLWSDWPEDTYAWNPNIVKKCEEEFRVVFCEEDNDGWVRGRGKCLIVQEKGKGGPYWRKFNPDGILIQAGRCRNFGEYVWMTNCAARVTAMIRKEWANKYGVSYEEAIRKMELRKENFDSKVARKEWEKKLVGEAELKRRQIREKQIVEALSKVCEADKKR